jgi:hypothetical protein
MGNPMGYVVRRNKKLVFFSSTLTADGKMDGN